MNVRQNPPITEWCRTHTLTVKGLEVANYMISNGSELIAVENIPDSLDEVKMVFRSENVHEVYSQALNSTLPDLSPFELDRLFSMLTILIYARKQDLKEELGYNFNPENDENSTVREGEVYYG